jgi:2-polyprenyl-3-methyl-5-hydroxy-6-metoxy-1,4-benzoquinol methylase
MDKNYQETFNTWNKIAQLYEDKFMKMDLYNESYDVFCASLSKQDAAVLEIGCGPGNICKYLHQQFPDLKIKAIDISENMIALAKKNDPKVDFQVMDARDIHKLEEKYDAIICGFTLPYLSFSDCAKFIADCHQILNSDGILYLSYVEGDYKNSAFISGSTGDRTFFYYHEEKKLEKELQLNLFEIIARMNIDYEKENGTKEVHKIMLARK